MSQTLQVEIPRRLFISPYIPELSEQLRTVANRYEVTCWHSFSGKLSDAFIAYKDTVPLSKTRFTVYNTSCTCGVRYIGESDRNLKVCLAEHLTANSNSSLSAHLRVGYAHKLDANRTEIVAQESNIWHRKLTESLVILHGPDSVCNTGVSIEFSDMWATSVPSICAALA